MIRSILGFIVAASFYSLGADATGAGALENPQPGSIQSGIGLVSGWYCGATQVTVRIDGGPAVAAAYGTPRADTASVCANIQSGYGYLLNFNTLGSGTHTIAVFADGVQFQSATFAVVTLGQEFLRGAAASTVVVGFPDAARQVTLTWQESKQNFSVTAAGPNAGAGALDGTYRLVRSSVDVAGGQLFDTQLGNVTATGSMVIAGHNITQNLSVTLLGQTISLSATGTFNDLGAYIAIQQPAGSSRAVVVSRGASLILSSIGPASGSALNEIDQWAPVGKELPAAAEMDDLVSASPIAFPLGAPLATLLGLLLR
jgi:hypothetical protein